MICYFRLIINNLLPISYVTYQEIRAFVKLDILFSKVTFKEILFRMVELVEQSIKSEMIYTKVPVMHNGGTDNGIQYIGVFSLYNRIVKVLLNGKLTAKTESLAPILSMISMYIYTIDIDGETQATGESTKFSADVYIRIFETIY